MSSKLSLSPTSIHFILLCNAAAALDVLYRTILSALRDMSSIRGTGLYTSFPSPTLLLCIMYMLDNRCAIVRAQLRCYTHRRRLACRRASDNSSFQFLFEFLVSSPVCLCAFSYSCGSVVTYYYPKLCGNDSSSSFISQAQKNGGRHFPLDFHLFLTTKEESMIVFPPEEFSWNLSGRLGLFDYNDSSIWKTRKRDCNKSCIV